MFEHTCNSGVITTCVIKFCVKKAITFSVGKLLHFALITLLHFALMLLHFVLVLHFAAIVITFCGVTEHPQNMCGLHDLSDIFSSNDLTCFGYIAPCSWAYLKGWFLSS